MSCSSSSQFENADEHVGKEGIAVSVEKNKKPKQKKDLNKKSDSEAGYSALKFSETSAISDENKVKRVKLKGQVDRDSGISVEKSEKSSDEDSSERQEKKETQRDSIVAQSSKSDKYSFRKLKSRVKKRYYRRKSNAEREEEEENREVEGEQGFENMVEDDLHNESEDNDIDSLTPEDLMESEQHAEDNSDALSQRNERRGLDDLNEWTTTSEDDSDDADPPVLQKEKPKPKWFVLREVISRQIGSNPLLLPRRFYGSLEAVQRLKLLHKLNEHVGCINSISFNQKGDLLASGSDDLTVKIWDWAVGKRKFSFQTRHKSNIFMVRFLPLDVKSIVTCARDGQIRLLDLHTGLSRRVGYHTQPVHSIAVHQETPHVVLSAGGDGKVLSIDVREDKAYKLLMVKDGSVEVGLNCINYNPSNSNEFCVCGWSQAVRVYDRRNVSTSVHKLCPNHLKTGNKSANVTSSVFNYNGKEVLSSYNNEDIYLFDTLDPHPTGDFTHRYQGHRSKLTVKGVNFFGPMSEYIVSGSECGNIFFWDKDTESIVQWMSGDEQGVVNCVQSHPYVPVLATSGLDFDVKIWIPSSEEPPVMKELEHCVKSNLKQRAQEYENISFDSLWTILRRVREIYGNSSSDHNSSNNSDSGSDSDSEGRLHFSPS